MKQFMEMNECFTIRQQPHCTDIFVVNVDFIVHSAHLLLDISICLLYQSMYIGLILKIYIYF